MKYRFPRGNTDLECLFTTLLGIIHSTDEEGNADKLRGKISPEKIWAKLYPTSAFNENKLKNLYTRLYKELETYLGIAYAMDDKRVIEKNFLYRLKDRNYEFFGNKLKEVQSEYSAADDYPQGEDSYEEGDGYINWNIKDAHYYLYRFQIEELYQEYLLQTQAKHEPRREYELLDNFKIWTFVYTLKLHLNALIVTRTMGHDQKVPLVSSVIEEIRQMPNLHAYPLLKLFYEIYLLYEGYEPVDIQRLLDTCKKYGVFLPRYEYTNIFVLINNYLMSQIPKEGSYKALFSMYQWAIGEKLVYINNVLNLSHYRNIVLSGIHAGEFDLTEFFLEELKKYLPESFREQAYRLNKAYFDFYREDYHACLKDLEGIHFENAMHQISSRFIQLFAHYEVGYGQNPGKMGRYDDTDRLILEIRRLDHLLATNKNLGKKALENYKRDLNLFKRLERVQSPVIMQRLRKDIIDANGMYKEWMLKKLEEKVRVL